MTTLAIEYRPKRFADVVGQKHILPVLRAMVKTGKVPPALLFAGSRGTGKTTTGRIMAAALNCEKGESGDCCAECVSCRSVQDGSSLSVLEIDAASNGLVGDIRKLKDVVRYAHEGEWRIILLDEAHSMSREAFNALLKVLEEPPPQTAFILLTTERGKIPDTVASRSMSFEFRRLSTSDIVGRLQHISEEQELGVTDPMLVEIASRAEGGLRDAVMLLDQSSRVGVTTVEGFLELHGIKNVSVELFEAAVEQDYSRGSKIIEEQFASVGDATEMVNDLILLMRDLLIVRAGGSLETVSEVESERRVRLARRAEAVRLAKVVRVLWELRGRTRAADADQRASMEMAFVLICEALRPAGPIQSVNGNGNGAAEQHRLSLEEMRAMARAR